MTLINSIIRNLNESVEVKKTFGDKPEEGKELKSVKGKTISVPKTKNTNKSFKSIKLENRNKQAADVFVSDTDKVVAQNEDKKTGAGKGELPKGKAKIYNSKVEKPFGETIEESAKLTEDIDDEELYGATDYTELRTIVGKLRAIKDQLSEQHLQYPSEDFEKAINTISSIAAIVEDRLG